MGCYTEFKCLQIIAAFKRRDDSALRIFARYIHQLLRNPAIILLSKAKAGQRIARMGIETGGDNHQTRLEILERG